MTEEQWLNERNVSQYMVLHLRKTAAQRTKLGRRRYRVFATACGHIVEGILPDERLRNAIEIAGRFAEVIVSKEELVAIRAEVDPFRFDSGPFRDMSIEVHIAIDIAVATTDPQPLDAAFAMTATELPLAGLYPDAEAVLCSLLRCIFGNPFRPVAFAPEWRTTVAVGIAAQMYESREFGNLPVLADALEEAGCDHPAVLAHCREPGEHARGCWVVDGLLGKS